MTQPQTLATLQRLAEQAEQTSARTVAERRAAVAAGEERLAQLERYLAEYGQLSGRGDGLFIDTVRTRRAFVERLREAMQQQAELVASLHQQLENDLQHWREARARALGLERYQARAEDERALRQSRRDQAALDEVGAKMHVQRAG